MGGEWVSRPFADIYGEPSRNGLMRPSHVRGAGTKMVNMGELFAFDRIGDPPMERVPLSPNEAERFLLQDGDLLFARASLKLSGAGKCSLVLAASEPRTFESHAIRVRLDRTRAYPIFYYYFFRSIHGRNAVFSITEQVSAAGIRGTDLGRLNVPVPPLPEQKGIASILGSLDDKIELNRRMSETLETMARAIFKSWFVDFDPVHAKAAGRKPSGLDTASAALFPDAFQKSPLGPIPKSWTLGLLSEAFDINPRRSLRKGYDAPYVDMGNMPTTSPRPLGWINRGFTSGMKFINGDVLVARITPCLENGKTAYVDFLDGGQVGWGSTEYIVLRSKPPLTLEYAYFLARSERFRQHAIANMTGSSGRQRVPVSCFDSFTVVVPPEPVTRCFGQVAGPIMQTIKVKDEESRTLTAIRDALLPKLLSGEIRVPEAEKMVSHG